MDYLKRIRAYPMTALFTVVVVMCITFYALGFRLGPGLTLVRTGSLVLEGLPAQSVVYIDDARRSTSDGSAMHLSLVPGTHTIIIDAPIVYPWSDIVTIVAKQDTISRPLLVNKIPEKELLATASTSLAAIAFANASLPSDRMPLPVSDGCVLLSMHGTDVIGTPTTTPLCVPPAYMCIDEDCSPTIIFTPPFAIRNMISYPGRTDSFILSYGGIVVALELDPRKPQYVAPLFEGTAPEVVSWSAHSVVVRDAGNYYEVHLR